MPTPRMIVAGTGQTDVDRYPKIEKPTFGALSMDDIKEMVTSRDWQLTLAAAHIKALEAAFDEQAEQIDALKADLDGENGGT